MISKGAVRMSGQQLALEETYDCCRAAGLSHHEALEIARSAVDGMPGADGLPERRLVGLAVERAQAMLARRHGSAAAGAW